MLTVLVVSETKAYRDALAELLSRPEPLRVVATATRPEEALQRACELGPAVVVMDQGLPATLLLTRTLAQVRPDVRIVALGVEEGDESVVDLAEAGVVGYVPREGSIEELAAAIQRAARGELQCSPQLAGMLVRRLAWRATVGADLPAAPLTAREVEIVRLIDEGLSNKAIAARLGIEVATVKNHVHNLLEKLRVHRRGEAAARLRARDPNEALRRGLA